MKRRIIKKLVLIVLISIAGSALLMTAMMAANGLFRGSGKLHITVKIPAAGTYDGIGQTVGVIDAHPVPAGNMTHAVTLPDSTRVFTTEFGAQALASHMAMPAGDIAGRPVPRTFEVKEDTFGDKLRWAYIRWRGSAAGSPEGAWGNPDK